MKPPKDDKVKRPNGPWTPAIETDITVGWDKANKEMEKARLEREAERERMRKQIDQLPRIGRRL